MRPTYRLAQPLEGYCRDTNKMVTIPSGATITATTIRTVVGLCMIFWGAQAIWVRFPEAAEASGLAFELGQVG